MTKIPGHAQGRPFAWVDDDVAFELSQLPEGFSLPKQSYLLLGIDPERGLDEDAMEKLRAFAAENGVRRIGSGSKLNGCGQSSFAWVTPATRSDCRRCAARRRSGCRPRARVQVGACCWRPTPMSFAAKAARCATFAATAVRSLVASRIPEPWPPSWPT